MAIAAKVVAARKVQQQYHSTGRVRAYPAPRDGLSGYVPGRNIPHLHHHLQVTQEKPRLRLGGSNGSDRSATSPRKIPSLIVKVSDRSVELHPAPPSPKSDEEETRIALIALGLKPAQTQQLPIAALQGDTSLPSQVRQEGQPIEQQSIGTFHGPGDFNEQALKILSSPPPPSPRSLGDHATGAPIPLSSLAKAKRAFFCVFGIASVLLWALLITAIIGLGMAVVAPLCVVAIIALIVACCYLSHVNAEETVENFDENFSLKMFACLFLAGLPAIYYYRKEGCEQS